MSKIPFMNLLQRKTNADAFGGSSRKSLSVNSLSKISSKLTQLGRGETIRKASFWICFVLCANFTADLFALLFEKYLPSSPISALASRGRGGNYSNPMAFEVISDRNLFSSKAPKKPSDGIDLEAEPVATSLPLQLVGTVIFHNPARSLAAVQDKNENKLYPVRMGDQINDNVQILSVEARRVVFTNAQTRRKEFIDIPEDPSIKISQNTRAPPASGIAQVEENKFVLSKSEISAQMANFNTLITQARALPEMRGGQMVGFKITQIVPGSFYAKIGIHEGDIINSVNGEKITDAAKAMSIFQGISQMSSLDLGYERQGKAMSSNYDIR